MSDIELEKHAKEYHGLTLNQFKLMCNEADKRYEGQFANSVDKHLAVECFYEGFKVAISGAPSWQGLSNDEIINIIDIVENKHSKSAVRDIMFSRAIEQELKEKNKVTEQ